MRVMYGYPDEHGNDVLVSMSRESAMIEALRQMKWYEEHGMILADETFTPDEVLVNWMVCHWAWFDD